MSPPCLAVFITAYPWPTSIYDEDSVADTDGNFVMTGAGDMVEIQATAEGAAFGEDAFMQILALAKSGIAELVVLQKQAVGL